MYAPVGNLREKNKCTALSLFALAPGSQPLLGYERAVRSSVDPKIRVIGGATDARMRLDFISRM